MAHNHDLQINTNTAPDNNAVHEAVLFFWGERCPDYEAGCPTCEAWKQYDMLMHKNESWAWHEAKAKEYDNNQGDETC